MTQASIILGISSTWRGSAPFCVTVAHRVTPDGLLVAACAEWAAVAASGHCSKGWLMALHPCIPISPTARGPQSWDLPRASNPPSDADMNDDRPSRKPLPQQTSPQLMLMGIRGEVPTGCETTDDRRQVAGDIRIPSSRCCVPSLRICCPRIPIPQRYSNSTLFRVVLSCKGKPR